MILFYRFRMEFLPVLQKSLTATI